MPTPFGTLYMWSLKRLFPARPSLLMGGFESRLP
jgi:hypothetical protein